MRSDIITLTLVFALFCGADSLHAQNLERQWSHTALGGCIGCANIIVADLEGTGTPDLVVAGRGHGGRYLHIYRYRDGGLNERWSSHYFDEATLADFAVVEGTGGKPATIYALQENGRLTIYGGGDLGSHQVVNLSVANSRQLFYVHADIDYLVVRTDNILYQFDAESFELRRSGPSYGAMHASMGDVTGDGRMDLVLATGPNWNAPPSTGYVLDAETLALKWEYVGGFGMRVTIGDVTGDGLPEILGMHFENRVTVLDARERTPLWDLNVERSRLLDIHVADVTGNGRNEILVGFEFRRLRAYDAETHAEVFLQVEPGGSGFAGITSADVTGDGRIELIYGTGQISTGSNHLVLRDALTRDLIWRSPDEAGPFSAAVAYSNEHGPILLTRSANAVGGARLNAFAAADRELLSSHTLAGGSYYGQPVAAYDLTGNGRSEVINVRDREVIISSLSGDYTLWRRTFESRIESILVTDVTDGRDVEIVLGKIDGTVIVLHGNTFEEKWRTVSTGSAVNGLLVLRCDGPDDARLLAYSGAGVVNVYDMRTRLLAGQIPEVQGVMSASVGDIDLSGSPRIVLGHQDGRVSFADCRSLAFERSVQLHDQAVTGLLIANVDDTPEPEILIGTNRLEIRRGADLELAWASGAYRFDVGRFSSLYASDLTGDGHIDIVFSHWDGVDWYRVAEPFIDFTPPRVTHVSPVAGFLNASRSTRITATFSLPVSVESLDGAVSLYASGAELLFSWYLEAGERRLVISPHDLLPPETDVTVRIHGTVTSVNGVGLDGNHNGVAEGSPEDDFVWTITTGSSIDDIPPEVVAYTTDRESYWRGMRVRLNVTVADTSGLASSNVAYVEAFLNELGTDSTGFAFSPATGSFGEPIVDAHLIINTDFWTGGIYHVIVRAVDEYGNWSVPLEIPIQILEERRDNWPMPGGNAQNTRHIAADSTVGPFELAWKKRLADGADLPAVIVDSTMILATERADDPSLIFVDIRDGSVVRKVTMGPPVEFMYAPSYGYERIFAHTIDEQTRSLRSINAMTYVEDWASRIQAQWGSFIGATIHDGKVFAEGGMYGGLYAFDAFTGEELWFRSFNNLDWWAPAVFDGSVYVFADRVLYELDADTGRTTWEVPGLAPQWSRSNLGDTPAVVDPESGLVYTLSASHLTALNPQRREVVWQVEGNFTASPALVDSLIIVVTGLQQGGLVAYHKSTGNEVWSAGGLRNLHTAPTATANYVFVGSQESIFMLDIRTGDIIDSIEPGGERITFGNGHLVVAQNDGIRRAYRSMTGVATEYVEKLPDEFRLHQNYPNPFNPSTRIEYSIPADSHIRLAVYNVLGQHVATIFEGYQRAGRHSVLWNGEGFASGMYICRLEAGNSLVQSKMLLAK